MPFSFIIYLLCIGLFLPPHLSSLEWRPHKSCESSFIPCLVQLRPLHLAPSRSSKNIFNILMMENFKHAEKIEKIV